MKMPRSAAVFVVTIKVLHTCLAHWNKKGDLQTKGRIMAGNKSNHLLSHGE